MGRPTDQSVTGPTPAPSTAGRNIHALDPYRMPSAAALERGSEAARLIVESHRRQNGGAFPETVAVNLWGLDAIKTKGESVAIVLNLVGARPVREGASTSRPRQQTVSTLCLDGSSSQCSNHRFLSAQAGVSSMQAQHAGACVFSSRTAAARGFIVCEMPPVELGSRA